MPPAASKEKTRQATVTTKLQLLYARLDENGHVVVGELSDRSRLVLEAGTKDAARAFNNAASEAVDEAYQVGNTHWLGRLATLPEMGYTDFVAVCFANCIFQSRPLPSLGEASRLKQGALIVWWIPLQCEQELLDKSENSNRAVKELMGENVENLTRLKALVVVNK